MSMTSSDPPPTPPRAASPVRTFGRFELRSLLGKSVGTTVWLAFDPRLGSEVMITVPRVQPGDANALQSWSREVHKASRLEHPHLATVIEIGMQDRWPFVVVERRSGLTLGEFLAQNPPPSPVDLVNWMVQVLEALAFAHDSGCTHNDLQLQSVFVGENGKVQLFGLAAAGDMSGIDERRLTGPNELTAATAAADVNGLQVHRKAAERDVLACGVLLHRLLANEPVLEQPDIARVIARMSPLGREIVHLPWTTPHPVPEALRVIANRSTSSHERQRYLSARTLLRALTGWQQTFSEDNGGPLALLLDRLRTVGHLPAQPGVGAKLERLLSVEGRHADALVAELLQDMALSLELLKQVNSALVRNSQNPGDGAVLTLKRSVALLGVKGVRQAASSLRRWPGPLSEAAALGLKRLMDRVRLAGHVAQALRPAGYDPEVIYLVTLMQNLGRLMVRYHFPDESEQIAQLTSRGEASSSPSEARPESQGMSEAAASYAVLGVDVEELGAAVARHWGLGAELQQMIRRVPRNQRVRTIQGDTDALCKTASAANEVVDALGLTPPARAMQALEMVAERYSRVLKITLRDVKDAVQDAREALRSGVTAAGRASGSTESATSAGPGSSASSNPSQTPTPAQVQATIAGAAPPRVRMSETTEGH